MTERLHPLRERQLRIVAIAAASMGVAALFAHVFGWLPMPFFLGVLGVPSLVVLLAIAAHARRVDAELLLNGLAVGSVAGLVATIVYDAARTGVELAHPFGYDWTVPIRLFGHWITGEPPTSMRAQVAGWIYHYWNGITFGIMFAVAVGRVRWYWGVLYGMFLEACMLGLFPMFLQVTDKWGFVLLSMIGHFFYGLALGLVVQRWALPSELALPFSRKD